MKILWLYSVFLFLGLVDDKVIETSKAELWEWWRNRYRIKRIDIFTYLSKSEGENPESSRENTGFIWQNPIYIWQNTISIWQDPIFIWQNPILDSYRKIRWNKIK